MTAFLAAAVIAGTPLLFATLGELITEKAGNLNLGVEGMMLMGAVMGFGVGLWTGNPFLALLGAICAGAVGAAVYAVLTVTLRANQVVTGLTLTIFGTGYASFVGKSFMGVPAPAGVKALFGKMEIPLLGKIPVIGPVFFHQDIFIYFGYLITILISIYLWKTKKGLNLRAVGENAAAADASGINVTLYKYVHIISGGGLCGLGGAYMSLVTIPVWQENVVAGRGWIAVALVIFASWKPSKALIGAFLFGGLNILGYRLQSMGIHISQYIVDMVPYAATILIVIISTRKNKKEDMGPADLSVPYFREDR
ncbi:ABC transporter permease [Sinanaerobacter chloroacetimidivorans]|uniref:ABC transporter permease n=1 Tax=Sinanaerobacter chloroacetimidivorans TaxID=2818044 RepID=A0A8J7VZE9_9FIRM|nr:ABC transporter permease [Sinanaerobacter chloroacetimidivorans]MBR0597501.1 ABC transporter permease [Sinanaerobacter chloroacetimidivorans]